MRPEDNSPQGALRAEKVANFVREMTTQEDLDEIMRVLRDARDAMTTCRSPRKGQGNDYAWVEDWPVRLAAIKIHTSYLASMPAQRVEVAPSADFSPPSVDEQVAALKAAGTDLKGIIDTWTSSAKHVEEVALRSGRKKEAEEIKELSQTIERQNIVDV